MTVCWVILSGQQIDTVIQAVHSLIYIVAKCNFFSVVTWKDIIKYLQKCEGCTHFCEILNVYECELRTLDYKLLEGRDWCECIIYVKINNFYTTKTVKSFQVCCENVLIFPVCHKTEKLSITIPIQYMHTHTNTHTHIHIQHLTKVSTPLTFL